MIARPLALAAAVAGAAVLAGCGKMGPLERPVDPLIGPAGATDAGAARNQAQVIDPSRPVSNLDPRDRTMEPDPPRTLPIEGSGQNPAAAAPKSALDDPYADPR